MSRRCERERRRGPTLPLCYSSRSNSDIASSAVSRTELVPSLSWAAYQSVAPVTVPFDLWSWISVIQSRLIACIETVVNHLEKCLRGAGMLFPFLSRFVHLERKRSNHDTSHDVVAAEAMKASAVVSDVMRLDRRRDASRTFRTRLPRCCDADKL